MTDTIAPEVKDCQWCGKPYSRITRQGRKISRSEWAGRKFCSPPCGHKAREAASDGLQEIHLRCLRMAAKGMSNAQIGRQVYAGRDTVKGYMSTILRELGAVNRAHAVNIAWEIGLLKPDGEQR
jgi:DNA-binding CsgD family transcriptional regulator